MKRYFFTLLVGVLVSAQATSQHVFWVTFTSKDSGFSISRPQEFLSQKAIARRQKFGIAITENDIPVNASFISAVQEKGYTVLSKSKWQNGIAVKVPDKKDGDSLKVFPFVKQVQYLGNHKPIREGRPQQLDINEMLTALESRFEPKQQQPSDTNIYGKSWNQVNMMKVQRLHSQGFDGSNVLIAVLDAGFNNADKLPVFKKMFDEHRVITTYDVVQKNEAVYEDDDHGMAVLSCMAGNIPGTFMGTAPRASYALLRSEYAVTEMPVEEVFWAEAIEFADSIGADIVNSSLGYNEFDDSYFNHTYKDLNGKRSIISTAATMAVARGMVVVVSAGNEGDEDWRFISVPADAAEVITVGGVTPEGNYAAFSSTGPTADKRIKPDVVAQADNVWVASSRGVLYQGDGTSYSSPLLTGAIACLMQAHPGKKPAEIMQALHLSGSLYSHPDAYRGYGIPDMQLAHLVLSTDSAVNMQLLDARLLEDGKVHMTLYTPGATKVSVVVRNEWNEVVLTDSFSFKVKKVNREALKKSKKLKKGIYSLQLISKEGTHIQTIAIH